MKVLEDTIMGKVSYGAFVYPSGIGGANRSGGPANFTTLDQGGGSSLGGGGSFGGHGASGSWEDDHKGADWGAAAACVDVSIRGSLDNSGIDFNFGYVSDALFGGGESDSSNDSSGFSSDIGGDSGYGGIGL